MFLCAGKTEIFPFAKTIGMGLVESSITLTRSLLYFQPEFLIFLGSAGTYSSKYSLFDIIESNKASQIETGFWNHDCYTPLNEQIITCESSYVKNPDIIVNSSNYITLQEKISHFYTQHSIYLENMEFYSVLKVAQEFGIPAMGIFVVTNTINSTSHQQYCKNYKKGWSLLEEYVKNKYCFT